jgi:hypothetical protein
MRGVLLFPFVLAVALMLAPTGYCKATKASKPVAVKKHAKKKKAAKGAVSKTAKEQQAASYQVGVGYYGPPQRSTLQDFLDGKSNSGPVGDFQRRKLK